MFSFRRYLPIARDADHGARVRNDSSDRSSAYESPNGARREIEMASFDRSDLPGTSPVYRAQVLGIISPPEPSDDSFHDIELDDSPSPSAVAAVRVCVWSFFLIGFLMMIHGQQEKFNSDRSRGNGRLRTVQLIHLEVPWTSESVGLVDNSVFIGSLVDRKLTSFEAMKFEDFSSQRENQGILRIESKSAIPERPVFVQRLGGETIYVSESGKGIYSFEFKKQLNMLKVGRPLVFFNRFVDRSSSLVLSRDESNSTLPFDCLSSFETSSSSCSNSVPIMRGTSYFYDHSTDLLVSVGTDEFTVDMNGYDASGVFVQAYDAIHGSLEFSITIPFLNRYEEGVWAIQNAPSTDGYLVLVSTMGFPPAPVQHVVLLSDREQGPKGTVLKLDDAELNLFRKADSLKFNIPLPKEAQCSC